MDEDNSSTNTNNEATIPKEENLESVKRRALEALTPILSHLKDIDPAQKFDICISAMRFTDDKNLAETALETALAIQEEGPKAEALVELVNEINYLQQA